MVDPPWRLDPFQNIVEVGWGLQYLAVKLKATFNITNNTPAEPGKSPPLPTITQQEIDTGVFGTYGVDASGELTTEPGSGGDRVWDVKEWRPNDQLEFGGSWIELRQSGFECSPPDWAETVAVAAWTHPAIGMTWAGDLNAGTAPYNTIPAPELTATQQLFFQNSPELIARTAASTTSLTTTPLWYEVSAFVDIWGVKGDGVPVNLATGAYNGALVSATYRDRTWQVVASMITGALVIETDNNWDQWLLMRPVPTL
jgi:hypothetical protein